MAHQRTIWITIGADGRVVWPDGRLDVPRGFSGKLDGYPEGTIVEVVGTYERVDAHTKTLEIQRIRVADTPVDRAVERWRRVSFGDDPKSRPEWPSFVEALHAIRADASPAAILLRAWKDWLDGDRDLAKRLFGEALTLDTMGAEALVRALWKLADGVTEEWSKHQREELVRAVWRSPPGWDWVHPFVQSFWMRPVYPLHFGGPRPNADEGALRAWVGSLVLEIATREEKQQIAQIEKLQKHERRALVSRLRAEDESRYDDAYTDMVRAWSRDSDNDLDSPPDDVAVTWTEESRRLPVRWCGLMSGSTSWDDRLDAAGWLVPYWRERGRDPDALALLADAACIVSSLDAELLPQLERVVFAHAGLTEGCALVRLRDGRACLLEAPDGAFGSWTHRTGDVESLVGVFQDPDLVQLALARNTMGWSTRSYRIVSYSEAAAAREGTQPARSKKPKVEPEKPRWVVHAKHGRGLVVGSIPGPKGPKLVIEFETAGRKTLLHTFVEDE